jgi:hypothetical protein
MAVRRVPLIGVIALIVVMGGTGCGALPVQEPVLQLEIENKGMRPATFDIIEYDFATGEAGERLAEPMGPLDPDAMRTADLAIPNAESWAFTINGITAVTSLAVAVAEAERTMPGEGPLVFHVLVGDEQLNTATSRGGTGPGITTAPDGTPP